MNRSTLVSPYGGQLIDLINTPTDQKSNLEHMAKTLPSLQLSPRALCDFELLATGGLSPLDRFMGEQDYLSVLRSMRLGSGLLFPIPITLPVRSDWPGSIGSTVTLRDGGNNILAVMRIEERYRRDHRAECLAVAGTLDPAHPLVAEMEFWGEDCISGPLTALRLPRHYNFLDLRLTPAQTRKRLKEMGRSAVVAFQTRNPIHRAHEELTKRAAADVGGSLLIHPVVGLTKPGDVDAHTRVRCYRALVNHHYDHEQTLLAVIPLAMRMAGPREAIWHALVRRNYGASHFVVGRDHAGPGIDSTGRPFYAPEAAQALALEYQDELGVQIQPFEELVYHADEERYVPASSAQPDKVRRISGTDVRDKYLSRGVSLPSWFTRPEVSQILEETHVSLHKRGLCVWFTGLSGAGKSTIASILTEQLVEAGRAVTVLDGDIVRTHLSKGLGFSRADRDANVLRIGFVASEIVRHNGVVVCAAVSPYESTRQQVRDMVGAMHFVIVHVATPLSVCETRDVKGLYAKAKRGEVSGVTGIDDPYEAPEQPDVVVDGSDGDPMAPADRIFTVLEQKGFVRRAQRLAEPAASVS